MAVDPRNTSRRCHYVACGHTAHADTVGALNVLRAGLASRQATPGQRKATPFRGWTSRG